MERTIPGDVSKCVATNCEVKDSCLRFTGKSGNPQHQVMSDFSGLIKDGVCDYHISNKENN